MGATVRFEIDTFLERGGQQQPATPPIWHLRIGRDDELALRYREDGRWVQVDAIQHFVTITKTAITAYQERAL